MELIQELIKQLGVTGEQAEGGTGLLMNVAKEKLDEGQFSQVAELIPGLDDLLGKAPAVESPAAGEQGGAVGMLGGVAKSLGFGDIGEKLGDLAGIAKAFESLGLDASMVSKFVSTIVAFLQSKGGEQVATILKSVLK
ncbi:MAG: DUF2780 domain-containing protein [Planctomycetota bacterium]